MICMKKLMLLLLLMPALLYGQEQTKEHSEWRVGTAVGFSSGQSATAPLYQVVGGKVFDRYFAGIGIGYDQYEFNTIPLFVEAKRSFGLRQLPFIYVDAGYNLPGRYRFEEATFKQVDRVEGGIYFDAGLGFNIPLKAGNLLGVSAGYSHKQVTNLQRFVYACNCPSGDRIDEYRYAYKFNRVLLKIFWEINW